MTDVMTERYGRSLPRRRRAALVASGLLGVIALTWLAWAVWAQATPEVQSSLRTFEVVDAHTVTADIAVHTSGPDVKASCLVRASGPDHSVVGELNLPVSGVDGTTTRRLTLRTERAATSVELVGCTTADQHRPR